MTDPDGNTHADGDANGATTQQTSVQRNFTEPDNATGGGWSNPLLGASNRPRQTTKETDPDTGLKWFGARLYDPAMGSWMGVEPLGLDGPNLYWATMGNPVYLVEANGRSSSVGTLDPGSEITPDSDAVVYEQRSWTDWFVGRKPKEVKGTLKGGTKFECAQLACGLDNTPKGFATSYCLCRYPVNVTAKHPNNGARLLCESTMVTRGNRAWTEIPNKGWCPACPFNSRWQ